MSLERRVSEVRGVGDELTKKFKTLGVESIRDFIHLYPRRYDDYSRVQLIARIKPGIVTIKGKIKQASGRYVRRGMHITEAVVSDDTGSVRLVWFNQPYRAGAIKADTEYFVSGEFQLSRQRLSILNPSVELTSNFPVHTARIVPVYRETKGLKSVHIRKALRELIPTIAALEETLPAWIIADHHLLSRAEALSEMHFPSSMSKLDEAKRRIGFEEVFGLTLAALFNKYELFQEKSLGITFQEKLAKDFVARLPFRLTDDQRKAVWQIYLDMQKTQPMNRLLEGDVGSGKTVVAAMAAVMALAQNFQIALMAPTEILARQHAETIHRLLEPLGFGERVGLLVGSQTASRKKAAHNAIAQNEMLFIIGTQALIQAKVDMHSLGLVIIDEQHRFGVEQRKQLQAKAGHMPHVLSMTATPIPRSLALTLYGDLDVSILAHKPASRLKVQTELVPPSSRSVLLAKVDKQVEAGRQVFVVCPLVTDSDVAPGMSAEAVYRQLSQHEFKHRRVGLLHGKLKALEKEKIMKHFVEHKLDVLVATTVIEVGVDVPNATVMIIENPERFGLAQLHQLRGRVGRGEHQSHCYLMLSDSVRPSRRLEALARSSDGFKLAELDLELRGPGAIYGSLQHGQLDLRVAQLSDTKLIAAARMSAQAFIDRGEDLLKYPELHAHVKHNRSVTNLN